MIWPQNYLSRGHFVSLLRKSNFLQYLKNHCEIRSEFLPMINHYPYHKNAQQTKFGFNHAKKLLGYHKFYKFPKSWSH